MNIVDYDYFAPPSGALDTITVRELGRARYADVWRLQHAMQAQRQAGQIGDTLLLTEHESVFTLGRSADASNLLVPEAALAGLGIDLVRVERGGDITYHGPGQLVAYPILDLHHYDKDVHRYVRLLEEMALALLARYGLHGERHPGAPGVWVGLGKVASVGVAISRWVTIHGIAINVDMDLSPFSLINPCGTPGLAMTTIALERGGALPLAEAQTAFRTIAVDLLTTARR